ncbi:MAG: stage V sporulation protein AD [Bacilli bacterium]|nr:stage V sporulation protein AD [Bacilli bacterium]
MTEKLSNVYVEETALVAGPLEKEGPLKEYFDKTYDDYNLKESLELSEVQMNKDVLDIILKKTNQEEKDIDLIVAGDLLNQLCATSYAIKDLNRPYLGVFSACATSMESVIIASKMIDKEKEQKRAICLTSSHNLTSEKQFRNPTEYGYTKPKTATFTSTGAAAIMLTNKKTNIKVTSYTIGTIEDLNQKDVNNMGAVMAPAAADTIFKHLTNLKITPDYYDLILTGDLGIYGKEILKDYMKQNYNITLNNYNDCGAMLYDMNRQKEITAGGSGPVCSCLVNYGYIYNMLKEKNIKKVLLVTTGALFSPTFLFQKQSILSIAHAVSLEAGK